MTPKRQTLRGVLITHQRRGMLLLMVLSMLTLFLLIGTLGLVLATRARESARAFAAASVSQTGSSALARSLLDEALMMLIRGPSGGAGQLTESLLADKYGPFVEGQLTAPLTTVSGSTFLLAGNITGIDTSQPIRLNGRIVTFVPAANDSASVTSYRIVEVIKDSTTFRLANTKPSPPITPPTIFPCRAIINGREFDGSGSNEAYDAFDGNNTFLTGVKTTPPSVTVTRAAFAANPSDPREFDNDGDGVPDGVNAPKIFPDRSSSTGSTLSFKVSYLVLDLDGRINLNAHGQPTGAPTPDYGPAALDISSIIGGAAGFQRLVNGGTTPVAAMTSSSNQWRPAPFWAGALDGRYGNVATTDPYTLRLDLDAARPAEPKTRLNKTSPFTFSELERVLRQFDDDAPTLPLRLAGLLDDASQRLRTLATTDSWDSPGLPMQALSQLVTWLATPSNAMSSLPPEVQAGLRFNINRDLPGNGVPEKQKFFEDFYTFVVAMGAPATEATAQWVANVVDFRDIDSAANSFDPPGGLPKVNGVEPSSLTPAQNGWNDNFRSNLDLMGIPAGKLADLTSNPLDQAVSLAVDYPLIVAACIVPSRFAGNGSLSPADARLSRWREPGRINACTCEDQVWDKLIGATGVTNPFPTPITTLDIYKNVPLIFDVTPPAPPPPTLPPKNQNITLFKRDQATRIGNIATTRSHVLAIWITLKITDSADPSSPTVQRLFAIVDRSVPVGYAPGEDLNTREIIRLKRFLQ